MQEANDGHNFPPEWIVSKTVRRQKVDCRENTIQYISPKKPITKVFWKTFFERACLAKMQAIIEFYDNSKRFDFTPYTI